MTRHERYWKERCEELEGEKSYYMDALYLALGGKLEPARPDPEPGFAVAKDSPQGLELPTQIPVNRIEITFVPMEKTGVTGGEDLIKEMLEL